MIRLLIADDHPVVREGLKRLIGDTSDMEVVGEAVNGVEVMQKLREHPVDVLLLDISMPGGNIIDTLQRVHAELPDIKTLVLSIHPEDKYALRAFKAGASGYLTKEHSPEELVLAIRRVCSGGKYVTASLAEQLLTEHLVEPDAMLHEKLSNRQYEILCLIGAGKRLKDIAAELSVSPKTVSAHRSHILEKLRLRTTADLIRYSMDKGLIR